MTIRKGDMVKYVEQTGIVLSTQKKEVARNKSKHVMEIVIAHTAEILWDSGTIENDIPIEYLELVSRSK